MDSPRFPAGFQFAGRIAAPCVALMLSSCGGSDAEPRISIESPATASATTSIHFTSNSSVRLAGGVENAPFVRARNQTVGLSTEASIVYQGERGTWVADVRLEPGQNVIFVTAFTDGGGATATRRIDVTRVER